MRRGKYRSLGILDELFRLVNGFHLDPSKNGLYESLPSSSRPSRIEYSKVLYQLQRIGYITKTDKKVSLTDKGEQRALLRSINGVAPPKKRDGYYRLIAFDIPEDMRSARDMMRSKLYEFKCSKIQKSLYLTPYVCEGEIEEIGRILNVQRHIQVFVLKSLPQLRNLSRSTKRTEVKN